MLKTLLKLTASILILSVSTSSNATYNANLSGTVTQILTYNTGIIMFSLNNQPTSNGSCGVAFFELDPPATPASPTAADQITLATLNAANNRMYARLLEAYTLGQPVNVGFDNAANCSTLGFITVYRIG